MKELGLGDKHVEYVRYAQAYFGVHAQCFLMVNG